MVAHALGHAEHAFTRAITMVCNKEVKMTLDQLKTQAKRYLARDIDEAQFHEIILLFLEDATPDDYAAFALWLNESKTEH